MNCSTFEIQNDGLLDRAVVRFCLYSFVVTF